MRILLGLFLFSLVCTTHTVNAEEYDVRKVRWGMSKQEVIRSESTAPIKKTSNSIIFSENILGKECRILYKFSNTSKLTEVAMAFFLKNTQETIEIERILSEQLDKKYKYEPNEKTDLIRKKIHIYEYETDRTDISFVTLGLNIVIGYKELKTVKKENEQKEKQKRIQKENIESELLQF